MSILHLTSCDHAIVQRLAIVPTLRRNGTVVTALREVPIQLHPIRGPNPPVAAEPRADTSPLGGSGQPYLAGCW